VRERKGVVAVRRIIVACGTAIATSTHVAERVRELLAHHGYSVPIVQCRVTEVMQVAQPGDLVISTTHLASPAIRVLDGVPFLTGIGLEPVQEAILQWAREGT